ncbi:MAG: hypothetical protein U0165_15530 [Polyangiaceae bacterium]
MALPKFEDFHGVKYTDAALEAAARLSAKYLRYLRSVRQGNRSCRRSGRSGEARSGQAAR